MTPAASRFHAGGASGNLQVDSGRQQALTAVAQLPGGQL
ncbi:hypothetical protein C4J85_1627 [Pseudomonas sp. R4-34-07]|nr:hypothetical protein C4J88_1668 [Pseudomonas sp. R4-39-08]AZF52126.1 hypothetical protein C4J85_1627 [Pseudomonas sp. R4-34-07]